MEECQPLKRYCKIKQQIYAYMGLHYQLLRATSIRTAFILGIIYDVTQIYKGMSMKNLSHSSGTAIRNNMGLLSKLIRNTRMRITWNNRLIV